jgi:hypothetical protein
MIQVKGWLESARIGAEPYHGDDGPAIRPKEG